MAFGFPKAQPLAPDEHPPDMLPYAFMADQQPHTGMAHPFVNASPQVVQPTPGQNLIDADQAKLQKVQWAQSHPWGTPENHPGKLGRIAHVLSVAGNIAGNIVAPGTMSLIPGSQLNMQDKEQEAKQQLGTDIGNESLNQERAAQTAASQSEVPLHQAQTEAARLIEITPEMAESLGSPALTGQRLTQGALQHMMTTAATNAAKVQTTGMTVQGRKDVADANNLTREKLATLKPEQRDDHAIRIMEKPPEQRTQDDNAYLGAYSRWVDQTKVQPGVARAVAFGSFRPVQVVDPNTNEVHYEFSGNAIKSGAASPQSMNFRTAVKMMALMTSGKGGQTLTAYRTANDHLDLLEETIKALNNGDQQTLNRLSNRFKEEFGSSAPTNLETVGTMLSGELANIAKVTGATQPEIEEYRKQLKNYSSPEQFQGFIDMNHDLMDQKALEMAAQHESAMRGQPNFGKGIRTGGEAGGAPKNYAKYAVGAGNHRIGSNDNGDTWYDVQTGKKVQ